MPLRGDADTSVAVASVLAQAHRSLELRIVIDDCTDASAASARRTADGDGRVQIETLRNRAAPASLVCHAQIQALEDTGPGPGAVAFAAGDTVWHPQWLTLLLGALEEPNVGATLGNRWYRTDDGGWGALFRRLWNAGAVVIMWWLQIPWAGGMAVKRRAMIEADVIGVWRRSMVEDVSVVTALRKAGWKFRLVPDCIAVEDGEPGLAEVTAFIHRQDLWARIYHPKWLLVMGHALLGAFLVILPLLLAAAGILTGEFSLALHAIAIGAGYVVCLFLLLLLLESDVNGTLDKTGQARQRWSARLVMRTLLAIPVVALFQAWTSVRAQFARQVAWAGVHYTFDDRRGVSIVCDRKRKSGVSP